jgi:hypothetical protein
MDLASIQHSRIGVCPRVPPKMPQSTTAHELRRIVRADDFQHNFPTIPVLVDYFSHTAAGAMMNPGDNTVSSWQALWQVYRVLLLQQCIPPESLHRCLLAKQLDRFFKLNLSESAWAASIGKYDIHVPCDHIMLPEPESCDRCHSTENLQRCSRCKAVHYCGRECQTADWKNHKPHCLPELGYRNVCPNCHASPYTRPAGLTPDCPKCYKPTCLACAARPGQGYDGCLVHRACFDAPEADGSDSD